MSATMIPRNIQRPKDALDLIRPVEAAQFLGVSVGTMNVWRCTGRYPLPFVKVGRSVRYRIRDLEAFVESRTVGVAVPTR